MDMFWLYVLLLPWDNWLQFAGYNDINDDTRMQLELINQTLAELQAKKKLEEKPHKRTGFIHMMNNLILPSARFYKNYNTSTLIKKWLGKVL